MRFLPIFISCCLDCSTNSHTVGRNRIRIHSCKKVCAPFSFSSWILCHLPFNYLNEAFILISVWISICYSQRSGGAETSVISRVLEHCAAVAGDEPSARPPALTAESLRSTRNADRCANPSAAAATSWVRHRRRHSDGERDGATGAVPTWVAAAARLDPSCESDVAPATTLVSPARSHWQSTHCKPFSIV